jgi:predicted nucleic-acid-binding protein
MSGALFCLYKANFFHSVLNTYFDWKARFVKILAFKTAKVAGISELI